MYVHSGILCIQFVAGHEYDPRCEQGVVKGRGEIGRVNFFCWYTHTYIRTYVHMYECVRTVGWCWQIQALPVTAEGLF